MYMTCLMYMTYAQGSDADGFHAHAFKTDAFHILRRLPHISMSFLHTNANETWCMAGTCRRGEARVV